MRGVCRKEGSHARGGLVLFATVTDPNGGETQLLGGSGARPGPFRRATPLSPHVSLAIAGIRVKIRGYCPCFATGRKSYAFF